MEVNMTGTFCERCRRRVDVDGPNAIVRTVVPFDAVYEDGEVLSAQSIQDSETLYFHKDCAQAE
jgi:hypothetical protein